LTHYHESQFRFLSGWLRNAERPEIHKQVMGAGNPPTSADGGWVIDFWAPWLDKKHHNPAKEGELRWFIRDNDKDVEVDSNEPVLLDGDEHPTEPKSRTFISAKVEDNPYLMDSGYMATLQALPEPLRSQMLKGDFGAGIDDDVWQVIPTEWVDKAMQRWEPRTPSQKGMMDVVGVDPARGGHDEMVISPRHGNWFDELVVMPGASVPDGSTATGRVVMVLRDRAVAHVDVIGIGGSVYDHLKGANVQTVAMNASESSTLYDRSGQLAFFNKRSEWWWTMREALDPDKGDGLMLPPDQKLKADLCAPRWRLQGKNIQVEPKDTQNNSKTWGLKARLGRSPDRGDAIVIARVHTAKRSLHGRRNASDWRT
jgi:hypothetical protein